MPISDWFFIVASFGSLFMVVGKRRAEAEEMGADAAEFRATLGIYSAEYLSQLQTVAHQRGARGLLPVGVREGGRVRAPVDPVVPAVDRARSAWPSCATRCCSTPARAAPPKTSCSATGACSSWALVWAVVFAVGVYAT